MELNSKNLSRFTLPPRANPLIAAIQMRLITFPVLNDGVTGPLQSTKLYMSGIPIIAYQWNDFIRSLWFSQLFQMNTINLNLPLQNS